MSIPGAEREADRWRVGAAAVGSWLVLIAGLGAATCAIVFGVSTQRTPIPDPLAAARNWNEGLGSIGVGVALVVPTLVAWAAVRLLLATQFRDHPNGPEASPILEREPRSFRVGSVVARLTLISGPILALGSIGLGVFVLGHPLGPNPEAHAVYRTWGYALGGILVGAALLASSVLASASLRMLIDVARRLGPPPPRP